MKRLALLGTAAVIGLAIAVAAISTGNAAPPSAFTTLTFKEAAKGSTFKFIDVRPFSRRTGPRASVSLGDRFIFGNTLLDSTGRAAGRVEGSCTALRGAKNFGRARWGCDAFARLAGGTFDISADFKFTQTIEGPIRGGTGAYEGARGSFTSSGEPSTDTFHFTTE